MNTYSIFAVAAPGLEELSASECRGLGFPAEAGPGGASWDGPLADVWNANLRLRTASRILVRAGRFRARTFHELERRAARVAWDRFISPGRAVRLRVTCRKSRLYHQGAVAERLLDAIEQHAGVRGAVDGAEPETGDDDGPLLFVVRMFRDVCTLSADSSGALLHQRGYRQAVASAPLRETLAAAMLLSCGWDGRAPLIDPLCGSGTIAIEGALMARRIAPGLATAAGVPRRYSFQQWPDFDDRDWHRAVEQVAAEALSACPATVSASDSSAAAIRAARSNAARAGVADDVDFTVRPLDALDTTRPPGFLVTNPPYGVRAGDQTLSRRLCRQLDGLANGRMREWTFAVLSPTRRASPAASARRSIGFATRNGGIPVELRVTRPSSSSSGMENSE